MISFKLERGEFIQAAWGENCSGPGWANTPIFVLIREVSGKCRIECIQPEDQTVGMVSIFQFSALSHNKMIREVANLLSKKKK